jgi:hypothetical protein
MEMRGKGVEIEEPDDTPDARGTSEGDPGGWHELRTREVPGAELFVFALVLIGLATVFAGLTIASSPPGTLGWADPSDGSSASPAETWSVRLIVSGTYVFALAIGLAWATPSRARTDKNGDEDEGVPICPHCFRVLERWVDFCPQCARPYSVLSTWGPLEYVYASAWCLGHAAHGPSRPLHAVGLGVLLLPHAAGFVVAVLYARELVFPLLQSVGAVLVYGVLFSRCLKNQDSRDPERLDPARGPYGTPPWWSTDARLLALPPAVSSAPASESGAEPA